MTFSIFSVSPHQFENLLGKGQTRATNTCRGTRKEGSSTPLRIKLTKDVDRKHYIRPDEPEECMWMLGLTFVNYGFWVLAPVYGYLY